MENYNTEILSQSISLSSPIFILGNNRSGTSLLRLILNQHSKISIPPESHFFLWLEEDYGNWNNAELQNYITDLFKAKKFETWDINKNELTNYLKSKAITSYAELTRLIYLYYTLKHDNNSVMFWGDKNSLWIEKLEVVLKHFPEAFFIHLVRDGRDIACSYKSLNKKIFKSKYAPNLPDDVATIAKIWSKNINAVDHFFESVKKSNKITLRYEDLLSKPEQVLSQILDKLSLCFEKEQLNYFNIPASKIEPQEFLEWKEKLIQPLDIKNIGKFKNELTNNDIACFNIVAKTALMKYNYL